jgi:hypothetical protein
LSPFDAYKLYLAIKYHFNSDYDYVKYQGKVRATLESFEKRKDKYYFEKLSKKDNDLINYYVSNLSVDPKIWIGTLASDKRCEDAYTSWLKRNTAKQHYFEQELSLIDSLKSDVEIEENEHPKLLRLFLQNRISLETMVILNSIISYIPYWNKKMPDDVVWQEYRVKIEKYTPFVKFEKENFISIVKQKL